MFVSYNVINEESDSVSLGVVFYIGIFWVKTPPGARSNLRRNFDTVFITIFGLILGNGGLTYVDRGSIFVMGPKLLQNNCEVKKIVNSSIVTQYYTICQPKLTLFKENQIPFLNLEIAFSSNRFDIKLSISVMHHIFRFWECRSNQRNSHPWSEITLKSKS